MTFQNSIPRISLGLNEHFLMLEDQSYIRMAAQLKLDGLGFPKSQCQIFSTPSQLEGWLATNNNPFKIYSHHFLENVNETGIQVIKRLGIADRSVLFTSAFDDPNVIRAAFEIGVNVISKDDFFSSRIVTIK